MRYNKTRKILIFWCLFIGIGAFFGSFCMFIDKTGTIIKMDALLPYFEKLPFSNILFQDYIFPGICLLLINGIPNIISAILLIKKNKNGIILGGIFGFILMLWITIQFIIFPTNILSISYFIFGFLQMITGYMCYVFYTQEKFYVDENKYTNIGKSKEEIVVYFSRMGYTKKIAYEIANKNKCEILQINPKEKIDGTLGFLWCGRFGMHKWAMNIEQLNTDFSKYKKVIIATPIWVFNLSSPVRMFCQRYSGKLNSVDYVITHFMKSNFIKTADEMDKILKTKRQNLTTICVRFGKNISEKTIN